MNVAAYLTSVLPIWITVGSLFSGSPLFPPFLPLFFLPPSPFLPFFADIGFDPCLLSRVVGIPEREPGDKRVTRKNGARCARCGLLFFFFRVCSRGCLALCVEPVRCLRSFDGMCFSISQKRRSRNGYVSVRFRRLSFFFIQNLLRTRGYPACMSPSLTLFLEFISRNEI